MQFKLHVDASKIVTAVVLLILVEALSACTAELAQPIQEQRGPASSWLHQDFYDIDMILDDRSGRASLATTITSPSRMNPSAVGH